jgi:hypothetical protein
MQNKIIIIVAKKGCGKSTRANKLILGCAAKKRVLVYDTLNEYDYKPFIAEEFKKAKKGIWKVCPIDAKDEKQFFASVCEFVYTAGDIVFLVDEIDMYCKPSQSVEYMTKICRYGRHRGVDLIAITRRPHDIPREITAMADEFHISKIQEPRDIVYLKTLDPDMENKLKNVKTYPEGYADFFVVEM